MVGAGRAPARGASVAGASVAVASLPRSVRLALRLALSVVAMVTCAPAVAAAPAKAKTKAKAAKGRTPSACLTAYRRGSKLEEGARLIEAKKAMALCSLAQCSAELRSRCHVRHAELEARIPSIVPAVTDAKGDPITDVEVTMDGAMLTAEIDGHAIDVNPGVHEFSFRGRKGVIGKHRLEIVAGQHDRLVAVTLAPARLPVTAVAAAPVTAAPPPAPPPAAPVSRAPDTPQARGGPGAAPYVLGTVGLLGVGGYGLLTYWGRKDNQALAQCAPSCPTTDIDHIRRMYLAADVSAGVGVVALVASTWLFIARSGSGSKAEASMTAVPRRGPAVVLDVKPAAQGALALVSGVF
jgi:hypothetical protein